MQNYQYYIMFKNELFNGFNILLDGEHLPNDAVLITEQQHGEYLDALNSQLTNIILVNGEIQIIDKYTPEELAAKQAAEAKQILINQANSQIHRDEHLWNNQIMWNRYTDEQKTILTNYYDDLIAVTRGESDILPTLTFKGL